MNKSYRPVALIILDGWGIRERESGNAVAQARTPNYDSWLRDYERAIIDASGEAVGLPEGQMGNSEVGHLNLGAGRVVYQDITRIDLAIRESKFESMPALQAAFERLLATKGKLHIVGLLGEGGVHSHQRHLRALLALCAERQVDPLLHLITDGRDTPPKSSLGFLAKLQETIEATGTGTIASVAGRYYTMDRDNRWERIKQGYDVIVNHLGPAYPSAEAAILDAHGQEVTDEFIVPAVVETKRESRVQPGDVVIFYNFRADRMRQIVRSLAFKEFDGFARQFVDMVMIVTMTDYEPSFPVEVIFPDQGVANPLAQVLSQAGLKQVHAAETEKYAHVTYFFNGGEETPFEGEDRVLVPSPRVATYDLKPEMSAPELTRALLERLRDMDDDFILVNFANPDMVGHSGDLEAAIKAVETVDSCAGSLVEAILAKGGAAIVTADHGNCEIMIDERTGYPHTYHTTQPVSLFVISEDYTWLRPRGKLADVAPTVLRLLGVEPAPEMSGESLV